MFSPHHKMLYLKQAAIPQFGRDLFHVVAVGFELPQPDTLADLKRQGLKFVA